jgi:hypothetical protein
VSQALAICRTVSPGVHRDDCYDDLNIESEPNLATTPFLPRAEFTIPIFIRVRSMSNPSRRMTRVTIL